MTPLDLDALEALREQATPGEWQPYSEEGPVRFKWNGEPYEGHGHSVCVNGGAPIAHRCITQAIGGTEADAYANAALIATTHNALPALIRAARDNHALTAQVTALQADSTALLTIRRLLGCERGEEVVRIEAVVGRRMVDGGAEVWSTERWKAAQRELAEPGYAERYRAKDPESAAPGKGERFRAMVAAVRESDESLLACSDPKIAAAILREREAKGEGE